MQCRGFDRGTRRSARRCIARLPDVVFESVNLLDERHIAMEVESMLHQRTGQRRAAATLLSSLAIAAIGLLNTESASAQADPGGPANAKRFAGETRVGITLPPRSTPAEKAVASLVLVFAQDWARRAVPAVMVDDKDCTLILTTMPAGIVPDGVLPAVEAEFLEFEGKAPLELRWDARSTAEIRVEVGPKGLTSFKLESDDTAECHAGDRFDVVVSSGLGRMRMFPHLAEVKAVGQEYQWKSRGGGVRKFDGLILVEGVFAEGTPMFKEGKLAGIVFAGARFVGREEQRAYVLPAERLVDFCRKLKRS